LLGSGLFGGRLLNRIFGGSDCGCAAPVDCGCGC
jgi:hypothetical protein